MSMTRKCFHCAVEGAVPEGSSAIDVPSDWIMYGTGTFSCIFLCSVCAKKLQKVLDEFISVKARFTEITGCKVKLTVD